MNSGSDQLTARWPDGRSVEAGADALSFAEETAGRLGEDPVEFVRTIKSDTTAGRVIRKLLGLSVASLAPPARPPHRPADPEKQKLLWATVRNLREDGTPPSELYRLAAQLLANPMARARRGMGQNRLVVRGNGPTPREMRRGSVENALRKACEEAPHWFFEVIENAAVEPQGGRPLNKETGPSRVPSCGGSYDGRQTNIIRHQITNLRLT